MARVRILGVALWLFPAVALAQVDVRVHVSLPSIRFEVAPPLVAVTEGVQVVPDYDEEVYFVNGWYWCRWRDGWYRARDHRGGWVIVEPRYVPVPLVRIPLGKYKHHRPKGGRMLMAGPGPGVTEVKVKHKGRFTEVKVKEKRGKGRWK